MKLKKTASAYSIFIGIMMIGMWVVFYVSGNIPELVTEPIRIGMHILAEIITAIMLVLGGFGVLANKEWGKGVYFISMGMLIYTLVQSPGYFLQLEEYPLVIMFGVMIVLAVIFTIGMLFPKKTN